jgi:hypothetical protein
MLGGSQLPSILSGGAPRTIGYCLGRNDPSASAQLDFGVECRTIVSIVAATIGTIVRQ